MVKVFGCGEAYENRPSTNPRACGAGLWGFRVLAERDDGGVGSAMAPTGTRRVRLCARRPLDWELAASELHIFCPGRDDRRADGGRRNRGRCGARRAGAMPGHDGVPVAAGAWGGARGCIQRSNVSTMRMRPPQQGQVGRQSGGSDASTVSGSDGAGAPASSSRARAISALRVELASKP